jgi:hypothetical protein
MACIITNTLNLDSIMQDFTASLNLQEEMTQNIICDSAIEEELETNRIIRQRLITLMNMLSLKLKQECDNADHLRILDLNQKLI